MFRILDVEYQRAVRIAHVADVGNVALDDHLTATGAVGKRQRLHAGAAIVLVAFAAAGANVDVGHFTDTLGLAHVCVFLC